MPAFRADVTRFFVADPFFSAVLPPIGNSAQNDFFPNGHGKVFDVVTGKTLALMAATISLFLGTGLDGTRPAEQADPFRQTAFTFEIFNGDVIKTRDFFLVYG